MIPINISSINNTINSLDSLISRFKDKLMNNPDEASEKLGLVMAELGKILEFIEMECVKYLEIVILPDRSNLISCRSALLTLESGYPSVKGYEARGHCHKIQNIYDKYLNNWFSKVLDKTEVQELENIFRAMNSADLDMITSIDSLARELKEESAMVLNLIDDDKIPEANTAIKQARIVLQSTRRQLVEAIAKLKLMESSFIASAQVV